MEESWFGNTSAPPATHYPCNSGAARQNRVDVLTAGVQELRFGSANATAAPSKDKALKLAKLNKELARSNSALKAEVASLKQDRSRLRHELSALNAVRAAKMSESNVPCDTQLRPLAGHDLHHSQPWHPHKDSMASEPSPTVSPESCSSSSSSSTAIPGDIRGGFGTSSGDSAASDEIHRTKAKAKGAAPSVDAGFPSEANLTCTCTVDAPALPTSAATSTHPPSDSPLAPTAASGGLKHHTAMFTPTPGCANKELSDVDSASAGSPPSQSSVPAPRW
eukprot:CAMPEP_0117674494 /NCGR_PEP_ID=MMETSP0804-20121206/15072_1 /TAXON_ID=1074897 /ORGANISM="Tetraselmis astigmatica, Strain CCMP880" /LENGTH=277 /DNA_ID=CAMNT_0005483375 /DNA_START=284 /DNA_END=1114 /DNA_ORIENTATION=-